MDGVSLGLNILGPCRGSHAWLSDEAKVALFYHSDEDVYLSSK